MALRTLSDFISEVGKDSHLQDKLYLAVKYDEFQQDIVTAINEITRFSKEEALSMLAKEDYDSSMNQKCAECQLLEEMIQQANLKFMTEGSEAASIYLKKRREEHLAEHKEAMGLCPNNFLNISNNPLLVYDLINRITGDSSKILENKEQRWKNIEPQKCAENISSFSNSHRLSIMLLLKNNELSFTELSEKTGLRTGHLQFHLRTLVEKNLVKKEERGIYGLGYKGVVALDHLADFERSMSIVDNGK